MAFSQKVRSALWAIVDSMACNVAQFVKNFGKDFTRGRKPGFVQLIRFFLCMESGCINHELPQYFYFLPDEVPTASAFIQQRAKLLPEAFRHILMQFNLRFPPEGLMGRYSLIAADGCEFNIARNPQDPSAFHPTSDRSNRGFASYNVFAHALEKGCFFAIRAKDINLKRLLAAERLPDRMDQWAEVILTRSNARKKRLHPEWESLYHYICKAVPFDFITDSRPEYRMRLRVVRFQIAEGVHENIITNLPSDEFSLEQIKHIYHLRWGQETSFRDLKHTIGTANFHTKSPEYIEFEILSRMILYNFCTIITMEAPVKKERGKWEYQVNLSMAIKICFAFLSDHMEPGNVNDLISRYILPIRPERTYARQLRFQVPASFAYRFV